MEKFQILLNQIKCSNETVEDIQKLRLLGSLIIINNNFEILKLNHRSFDTLPRLLTDSYIDRSGSMMISHAIGHKSSRSFSFFSKKKIYKEEEVNIIRYVYKKIFSSYEIPIIEAKPKLPLTYFVQFLLDCFIITQHFLSLFLLPLNKERIIDEDKFILSLESIQQMSFERASFFYQERDSQFKKNVAIQKMLCMDYLVFFKLIEFCNGNDLKEAELSCVLSMSLRNNKKGADAKSLAKTTFDRLEKNNNGVRKDVITFMEFFKILINNNSN